MQELARKKFQTIRDEIQCCKIISNTNQMDHSNPIIIDKMLEDQTNSFSEEPHAMENQPDTVSDKPTEKSACSSPKGHDRSEISPSTDLATNTETISSDNKSLSIEEDRRSTYITSKNQQKRIIQMDPSFNTLDDEKKLVSVCIRYSSLFILIHNNDIGICLKVFHLHRLVLMRSLLMQGVWLDLQQVSVLLLGELLLRKLQRQHPLV